MRKLALLFLTGTLPFCAQAPSNTAATSPKLTPRKPAPKPAVPTKLSPQQQFVLDVVRSAVGRQQQDPQDRLRVLATAIDVVRPVNPKMAAQYATEAAHIEAQLIAAGETPVASVMESGQVSCTTATQFVDELPPQRATQAEQSIIGAATVCPAATQAAQAKLDVAMGQGQVAPRALMAVAERAGVKSQWSQSRFQHMIEHLPDPASARDDAPNIAAMYDRMSREVDKDVAQKTGLALLDWLSKLEDGPQKNLSVKIVTGAMSQSLGKERYQEALRSDVIAQQVSNVTGSMEVPRPEEENSSVMNAMRTKGQDQSEAIRGLPPILRAKEASAAGFAEGTQGNKTLAGKYFDIAFSALDDAWQSSTRPKNAAPTIEEVCSAAAQVDYVDALKRAEHLSASAEQSVAMLAVARVVLGKSM